MPDAAEGTRYGSSGPLLLGIGPRVVNKQMLNNATDLGELGHAAR